MARIITRTTSEIKSLVSALRFLKENRIGKYFQDPKITMDTAIREIDYSISTGSLGRNKELVELRGLCATLLRREPMLLRDLSTLPSYPQTARIVGYRGHSSVMFAVKRYRPVLEEELRRNVPPKPQ